MTQQGIYRDSLSKCNTYQNPYDLRYANNQKLREHRAEVHRMDKIESQQSRIERETLNRFLSGNFSMPGGDRMLIVARFGKYVLLMVMLPPYIFFYGLPKWLANEGLPWGMDFFKNMGKPVQRGVKKLKEVWQAVRNLEKRVGESIDRGVTRVKEAMKSSLIDPMRRLFEEMQLRMQRFQQQLNKALEVPKSGMEKVSQTYERMVEALQASLISMANAASEMAKSVAQPILRPLAPFIAIMNKLSEIPGKVQEFLNPKIGQIQNQLVNLKDRIDRAKEALNRSFENVAKPVAEWVKEKYANAEERLLALDKRIAEFSDRASEKVGAFSNKMSEAVQKVVVVPVMNVINLAQSAALAIPGPVLKLMEPALVRGRKLRDTFQRGQKKFAAFYGRVKAKIQKRLGMFAIAFKRTYNALLDLVRWVVDKLLLVPAKLWKMVKVAFYVMYNIGYAIRYFFMLIIAWVKVLIWYGFKSLQERA